MAALKRLESYSEQQLADRAAVAPHAYNVMFQDLFYGRKKNWFAPGEELRCPVSSFPMILPMEASNGAVYSLSTLDQLFHAFVLGADFNPSPYGSYPYATDFRAHFDKEEAALANLNDLLRRWSVVNCEPEFVPLTSLKLTFRHDINERVKAWFTYQGFEVNDRYRVEELMNNKGENYVGRTQKACSYHPATYGYLAVTRRTMQYLLATPGVSFTKYRPNCPPYNTYNEETVPFYIGITQGPAKANVHSAEMGYYTRSPVAGKTTDFSYSQFKDGDTVKVGGRRASVSMYGTSPGSWFEIEEVLSEDFKQHRVLTFDAGIVPAWHMDLLHSFKVEEESAEESDGEADEKRQRCN